MPHTSSNPLVQFGFFLFLLLLLGGCLSCFSQRTVRRRNLTPQELVVLLRSTSVAFVNPISKERIERGEAPWNTPYCTGWFLGPRTIVTADHCFTETQTMEMPGLGTLTVPVARARFGQAATFVRWGQQSDSTRVVRGPIGVARITDISQAQDLVILTLLSGTRSNRAHLLVTERDPVPGDRVFALGHSPLATWAFSEGRVSRVERNEATMDGSLSGGWIQTSVPLAPGSSGGPMVNLRGDVIGVNDQIVPGFPGISIVSPWWSILSLWSGDQGSVPRLP